VVSKRSGRANELRDGGQPQPRLASHSFAVVESHRGEIVICKVVRVVSWGSTMILASNIASTLNLHRIVRDTNRRKANPPRMREAGSGKRT